MNVAPKEGPFIPNVIPKGNEEEKFRLSSLQHSYGFLFLNCRMYVRGLIICLRRIIRLRRLRRLRRLSTEINTANITFGILHLYDFKNQLRKAK